jgi:GAF domain-containing protein
MNDPGNHEVAQALADAAHAANFRDRLEDTLDVIARAARESVPGFDHVGVSVVQRDGAINTMASTGGLVREMDTLQYEFDQGPCMDAIRHETLVLVEDLLNQAHNWPIYAPRAWSVGVRAQMGVRVRTSQETFGSLNFYSTAANTIDPEAPRRAALFAGDAAIALDHARHSEASSEAFPTRQLVGHAVGILMEKYEITEDNAMYYLVRIATAGELRLRDLAREVVEQVTPRAT